ncbi:MAG: PBP1A family penicillin-binding protein [Actinomycetota bacterium]|nr:PBP1A family penicillin-binding protein [Actinomycetota bacterium]
MVAALVAAACAVEPLPDPGLGDLGLTTIVYAADGSVLAEWHGEEDRVLAEYHQLPKHLIDAVVAIEDERYWEHPGVDIKAVGRALLANMEAEDVVQGGSTITQQYLKNVLLTPEVSVDRKLSEAALALRLEEGLGKEEILERYLNTVYFGNGAYGVGAAARRYFGKDVGQLTLAQSALLAGLIRAPAATDPYEDPKAALGRRRLVLEKMLELRWIDSDAARTADQEQLALRPRQAGRRVRYPYFVEEVKRRLLNDPALGATPTERYNALFRGGLRIHTTLDPAMQEAAQAAVASVLPEEGPAGALVAIEPRTGHVLAMVGGERFYDPDDPSAQFNLATQGRRQTGSAFKPFVLAAALETGVGLEEVFPAGQSVTIATRSGPWQVENYNGMTFPDLTLLEATVFSVNAVYARLVDRIGPQQVVDVARAAGIQSGLRPYHAVALGAQEASVMEMASAFGTFAGEGIHIDPILVTTIETDGGVNLYESVPVVTQAFDRSVAERVTGALTEVVRRGTGVNARIGRPVAGKTGTSQEHRDAWFVGYTPELSAAVWVGYPQGQVEMRAPTTPFTITGGTWPAQIWARFASVALAGVPYGDLSVTSLDGQVGVEIDLSTGFLAGPFCPRAHVQHVRLPADRVPTVVCPIHNPSGVVSVGAGTVPDLIGLDLASAVDKLSAAGYQAKVNWADGGPLAQGTVFGQRPSPSFPAQSGSIVRLNVAGPEPGSVIPSVLGLPLEQAKSELEATGVSLVVIDQAEEVPEDAAQRSGLVWKQEPAVGTAAEGEVTIWVNP